MAAAYTPSATLAREGTDYQKGANARIRSANESAELGLISRAEADLLIVEELTEWVEDRLALMIAGDTPTRPKLTQALQEYNLLRSLAQQQGMNDFLTGPLAAFEADLKADWLTLYQSNQAPKCSAPMPDASDPFQHVFHISAISLANGWDFPTPSYPEDFCTQIKLVDAQAPPVVADEEGAPSGAVVNVSASYSIRTPAPGPPEEIEDRFARGTSHTVEADDSASICIVIDQGGTLQGEGCAPFEGSSSGQTATFTIDPSGVADLKVTLTLNLASLQIVTGSGEANTRELTSLRDVRELTLATPTSDLVAAPSTTPVCALVTRPKVTGSTAARAPEAGVTVRYDKQTSGGTIPSTMPIPEGPTGADGRFCADYVLSGLAKPSATSLSVRDLVTANATKTTGLPLTAVINMAPDWIDVRFFRSPGAGTLLERMLVVPTSHAFDSNRFSRWQAVVVRRDPFGTGPVVIEPDPDGDGVPRIGVTPGDGAIAIGGTQGGVGVATRVGDATLPFQICVCDAAVIAAGTTAVTFDARVGGITVSRQLDVSWTKLRDPDPPPPPPPPPPDNPPGPTTTVQDRTVYARVTTQDGRYIQGPGLHRATIQLMESSYYNTLSAELLGPLEVNPVLTRETLLTIEGQSRHCPGFSQFDGFFSGCGGGFSTGSGRVNDIEIEISGTHTLIKFHEGPRTFQATKVTRIRNFDGTYDEHVENITIIPGAPPDQGGGGGGGGGGGAGDGTRPPDDCLVSEAHVIGGASRNGSGGGAA